MPDLQQPNNHLCDKLYYLLQDKYVKIKSQFAIAYKTSTGETLNEDVFHDTLIKCAETLHEKGTNGMTEENLINYLYIAFKTNMLREKIYAYNKNKVNVDIDETIPYIDNFEYWNMRCEIKKFIIKYFDEKTFEECCEWIIDRKSVTEIEQKYNDKNLYYKFAKIKKLIIKEFGNDLFNIPSN